MTPSLPIRTMPFEGQCIRDYLNYLAEKNGWTNKLSFMSVLGLKSTLKNWSPGTASFENTLATLSLWTNDEKKIIETRLKPSDSLLQASHAHVGMNLNLHQHPRLCPQCIQENPWLQQDWRITHNIACLHHGLLLTDTCPDCHTQKSWYDAKRFMCSECDYDYVAGAKNGQSADNDYIRLQQFINQYPEHLSTVVNGIVRPADLLPASASVQKLQNSVLARLFLIAATVLTSAAYREAFVSLAVAQRNKFDTGDLAVSFTPYIYRLCKRSDFPVFETTFCSHHSVEEDFTWLLAMSSENFNLWVTPKRISHTNRITNADLACHCDTHCLADALQLQAYDIGKLIDCGMISPLKAMRTSRDMLFDSRTITLAFPCKPLNDVLDPISWQTIQRKKYYLLFNATLADLLEAIYTGKLSVYSDQTFAPVGNIVLSRHALNAYLDERLLNSENDIAIKNLAFVLGVSKDNIWLLVNDGHLYTNHWQSSNDVTAIDVKSYSVRTFLKNYISANRIGRLYGFRFDAVTNYLKSKDIYPDIAYPGGAFYLKCERTEKHVQNLINSYLKN